MDVKRSFSSSTLTMKESRSRPGGLGDRRTTRGLKPDLSTRGRRRSSLSDIYRNPQIYAGLRQTTNRSPWSFIRKCLLSAPVFAMQFCIVLTVIFSSVHLKLLETPFYVTSLHLTIAGVGGVMLTVSFQKYVQKFYGERARITQMMMGFSAYLVIGLIMVLTVNIERISNVTVVKVNITNTTFTTATISIYVSPNDLRIPNRSSDMNTVTLKPSDSSIVNTPSSEYVVNSDPVPLYSQILAFIGYIIVASSLSSGQYLLVSSAMSLTHTDDHDAIMTIATVAAAIGGCAVSFLGAIDLSSDWYPTTESRYHVYGQIFILTCVGIVLIMGCTVCAVITWYKDVITRLPRLAWNDPEQNNAMMNQDRRPTRTAQEIYDECAPLLAGPSEGGFASTIDENSVAHTDRFRPDNDDAMSFTVSQSGTAMEESTFTNTPDLVRRYSFNLPTTTVLGLIRSRSWQTKLKTQKKFILAMLLMFFMSSATISLEYNSSVFLSFAAYEGDDEGGHSYRKGARVGSAGIFILYLLFISVYFFYEKIPQQNGWKRLALGMGVLASVLTLVLALTDSVASYFVVTCVHGLLRVVVVSLPRLLTAQTAHTQISFQPSTVKQILIETPTTAIWCMTPLSLAVSSAIITPLTDALGCHDVPMYYSTASAVLSCAVLIALMS